MVVRGAGKGTLGVKTVCPVSCLLSLRLDLVLALHPRFPSALLFL